MSRLKPTIHINKLLSNRFIDESILNNEELSYDFEGLLGSLSESKIQEGKIIEGKIVKIENEDFIIDVNLKSEGRVPIKEFYVKDSLPSEVTIGSKVMVYLETIEGRNGNVVLSREKALRIELWERLEEASKAGQEIEGIIIRQIKCGFSVDIDSLVAFLPNSQIDIKQVDDFQSLIGTKQKFLIEKMDRTQANIVVSRKRILEAAYAGVKAKFLEGLNEGDIVEGKVKSIASYGAFIRIHESNEIGIIDGLLYKTDVTWCRSSRPHLPAFFSLGQNVKAKVIKIDREKGRISLGIKQLEKDPWEGIEEKYTVGSEHVGYVTNIAIRTQELISHRQEEYGAFVKLSQGIEGLVHLSEITWKRSKLLVSQLLKKGQEVRVKVLSINAEQHKMGLSIKECIENPLQEFANKYSLGLVVTCIVKDIAKYGIIVEFKDFQDIYGTINAADLSWSKDYRDEIREYKVGDKLKAKILRIDINRFKVNLGIKQLEYDPFEVFLNTIKVGDKLKATVLKIEEKSILVEVADGVTIFIESSNLPENKGFNLMQKIDVEVTEVGAYSICLSCKV
ncbi:30S ribosomal protein S1 [Candidatus Mesenet endosymbiont of Agriotes lineatus]|uniref:30S ribosomal protein S1 n=1 Tax=Candidatus Mesenet endosymbiont of Agriotes lineatus TaxID=3077948 RepID=UPI0030CF9407